MEDTADPSIRCRARACVSVFFCVRGRERGDLFIRNYGYVIVVIFCQLLLCTINVGGMWSITVVLW